MKTVIAAMCAPDLPPSETRPGIHPDTVFPLEDVSTDDALSFLEGLLADDRVAHRQLEGVSRQRQTFLRCVALRAAEAFDAPPSPPSLDLQGSNRLGLAPLSRFNLSSARPPEVGPLDVTPFRAVVPPGVGGLPPRIDSLRATTRPAPRATRSPGGPPSVLQALRTKYPRVTALWERRNAPEREGPGCDDESRECFCTGEMTPAESIEFVFHCAGCDACRASVDAAIVGAQMRAEEELEVLREELEGQLRHARSGAPWPSPPPEPPSVERTGPRSIPEFGSGLRSIPEFGSGPRSVLSDDARAFGAYPAPGDALAPETPLPTVGLLARRSSVPPPASTRPAPASAQTEPARDTSPPAEGVWSGPQKVDLRRPPRAKPRRERTEAPRATVDLRKHLPPRPRAAPATHRKRSPRVLTLGVLLAVSAFVFALHHSYRWARALASSPAEQREPPAQAHAPVVVPPPPPAMSARPVESIPPDASVLPVPLPVHPVASPAVARPPPPPSRVDPLLREIRARFGAGQPPPPKCVREVYEDARDALLDVSWLRSETRDAMPLWRLEVVGPTNALAQFHGRARGRCNAVTLTGGPRVGGLPSLWVAIRTLP